MLVVRAALAVALLLCIGIAAQSQEAPPQAEGVQPDQQADSPAKGQQDANPKAEPAKEDVTVVVPTPIEPIQPPIAEKGTTEQTNSGEEKAKESWIIAGYAVRITDFFIALFNGLLVIVTVFLAHSTNKLWGESTKATGIAKDAADAATKSADAAERTVETMKGTAERQLRAYVTVKRIDPVVMIKNDSDEIHTWGLKIVWQNTGQTPTRDMRQAVRIKYFENDIPKGYDFPVGPDVVEKRASGVIGPNCEIGSAHVRIEPEDLAKIQRMVGALYLWGIFEYNDVFEETDRHRTEYCTRVNIIWNPFDRERTKTGQIPFIYVGHYEHNSAT